VSAGNRTSADLLPRTKVVVGLSGASEDLILANAAISEARVRHCPLVAVRAVLGVPGLDEDQRQMIAAEANAWETLSVSTRAAAVQAGIEVRRGDPVEVLASQCGPQDLLVLGNRGAGHVSGIVPGSLTLRVINAVPCDVLLVPAGAGTRFTASPLYRVGQLAAFVRRRARTTDPCLISLALADRRLTRQEPSPTVSARVPVWLKLRGNSASGRSLRGA
jgi:nucleotide-binding universal stress UspA family protein